jgi:adenylate kinase
VGDELISGLVHEWLSQQLMAGGTILLDGYPRSRSQAIMLRDFLLKKGLLLAVRIIRFVLPGDSIIKRLAHRLVCSNSECQAIYSAAGGFTHGVQCNRCNSQLVRRRDDSSEIVHERLKAYQHHEKEVFDFYKSDDRLQVVELVADGPSDLVFERFCAIAGVSNA